MSGINNTIRKLQGRIDELRPLLNADEPWNTLQFEREDSHETIRFLSEQDVIKPVNESYDKEDKRYITDWKWKEVYKEKLEAYAEEMSTFPDCDHKATIHNPRWTDDLACPVCDTEYTKEQVKECL